LRRENNTKDKLSNKFLEKKEKWDLGIALFFVGFFVFLIILIFIYLNKSNNYKKNNLFIFRKKSSKIYPIVSPRQVKIKMKKKIKKINPLNEDDIIKFEVKIKSNESSEKMKYVSNKLLCDKNKNIKKDEGLIEVNDSKKKISDISKELEYYNDFKFKTNKKKNIKINNNKKNLKKEQDKNIINKYKKINSINKKNNNIDENNNVNISKKKTIIDISNELEYYNNLKNKNVLKIKKCSKDNKRKKNNKLNLKKNNNDIEITYLNKVKNQNDVVNFDYNNLDDVPKVKISLEDILNTYNVRYH
jgi:hypothetical protein